MLFSFFRAQNVCFFVFLFFFFLSPFACLAFSVSPSVSDVSFFGDQDEVSQLISVVNTDTVERRYSAELVLLSFASDGSISDFSDVSRDLEVDVFPKNAQVPAGAEQIFTVIFSRPERVTSDQVFGLLLHERGALDEQVSPAFVALLFPQLDEFSAPLASFRIDAFSVSPVDAGLQAVVQFTNTGTVVVRPSSFIIARNIFGRELARSVFVEQSGRLPVGTTRVFVESLPYTDFGFWHVGGPVSFSLLSFVEGSHMSAQASVHFFTFPGLGVIICAVSFVIFFVGTVLFFLKKRGILFA